MKHLDLLATQEDLSRLQRLLATELASSSFSDDGKEKVRDVVRELYTNLIDYAYPEVSDASGGGDAELAAYARDFPTVSNTSIGSNSLSENSEFVEDSDAELDANAGRSELKPVGVDYSVRAGRISLRFADRGTPFNLLEYTPPVVEVDDEIRVSDDETCSECASFADELEHEDDGSIFSNVFAGGLGIELIRSLTDELTYRYENGWNLVDLVILDT